MRLSEELIQDFKLLLQNPDVNEVIYSMRVCLLINDFDKIILAKRVCNIISSIIKEQKIILPNIKHSDILSVIQHIIETLTQQEEDLIYYLSAKILEEYKKNPNQKFDFSSFMVNKIQHSLVSLGFKKQALKTVIGTRFTKKSYDILMRTQQVTNNCQYTQTLYSRVTWAGMILCTWLAIAEQFKDEPSTLFLMQNMIIGMLFYALNRYTSVSVAQLAIAGEIVVLPSSTPDYKLELVHVFEPSSYSQDGVTLSYRQEGITFAASEIFPEDTDVAELPQESSHSADEDIDQLNVNEITVVSDKDKSLENKESKANADDKKSKLHQPQKLQRSTIQKPLRSELSWTAERVWFGKAYGNIINVQQATRMSSDRIKNDSHSIRCYGFFNRIAVDKQDVNTISKKNYQNRIERGKIIGRESGSGLKQLSPYIMSKSIKVEEEKFGREIFCWEAKTARTDPRLLGHSAATILGDDGTRHVLIDFCWHWPHGPGHS